MPSILALRSNGIAAQISASALLNGAYRSTQYGTATALQGPPAAIVVPPASLALATEISPGGSTSSVLVQSLYFPHVTVGLTSSQAGVLNVQRFIDPAGLVAQGPAVTTALIAATPAVIDVSDGKGFASFRISITNTSQSLAAISAAAVLLLAR